MPGPAVLGVTYLLSEILLTVTRRSRGDGARQDRSTLGLLWVVIMISVGLGVLAAEFVPGAATREIAVFRMLGLLLFLVGLVLRWWAIVALGRFFTVDVQIARDHEVVSRGPFRFTRHPSYTGVLLAFLGFSLSLANWLSLLLIMIPICLAFLRRMKVEEDALSAALPESYRDYMARTWRLIPGIY